MKARFFWIIMIACSFSALSAKKYMVTVDGVSTGLGTLTSPYDISTAISKAVAGDTVYIRGGVYMMTSQLSLNVGGRASAYINIWAYPGDTRPVLDFFNRGYSGTNAASERGVSVSKDYYFIKGLDVTRAGDNGMHIQGSYNKVQNCRFYKNCDAGMQITGGTAAYNEIIDCDAFRNFDFKSSGGAGGNADGFACKLTVGLGNRFVRCRSWENSDDGYDCYGSQNDIYFEDCWVMENGQSSYDVTDYPGGTVGLVTNTGNGNGFKVGGNGAVGGATLIRCVSIGHRIMSASNKGFDQNNSVGRVICSNCISYNDGRAFSFPNNTDTRGAHVFANNIAIGAGNANSFHASSIFKTNSWNGIIASADDFLSVTTANAKADRNADGLIPYMDGLFRLKSTSSLINAGTDVALPFIGIAPDLGPFEYNPATAVAIPVTDSNIMIRYTKANDEIVVSGSIAAVELFQLSGIKVFTQRQSTGSISIPTNNRIRGVYLLHIIEQNGVSTNRKVLVN